VEQLGAGSRTERLETLLEPAFQLVGSHGRRLRRRTAALRLGVPATRHSRTLAHHGVLSTSHSRWFDRVRASRLMSQATAVPAEGGTP
jgi:hypothetical protein